MFQLRLFCLEFRFHLLCSAKRCTAKSFGSLRALKRMITILLRYLCTDFFNRNPRFEDFHMPSAVEILDSFSFTRPLGSKVFFQWPDAPDVLLAMKYLRET